MSTSATNRLPAGGEFFVAGSRQGRLGRVWSERPFVVMLCVVAAAMLVAVGPDKFAELNPAVVVWGTAAVLLGLALYGFRVSKRRGDVAWFAPLYLVTAFYFFKYGWGCLVAYYWGFVPWEIYPELRNYFYRFGVWNNLPATCRLFLLGGLGIFAGACLANGFVARKLPRLDWRVSQRKFQQNILLFTPVVLAGFWFLSRRMDDGVPFVVLAFASITDALTIVTGYYAFSARGAERVKWLSFLVFILILRLPTALSSGQMVPVLMPGLMTLFGYVLARRSPPWTAILVSIPFAVLFLLPFTTLYKFAQSDAGIEERLTAASEKFSRTGYQARLELSLARTFARLCGAQFPAIFSQYYPRVFPYEHGRTFLIEFSGLVPRMLWPDKPEVSPELNRYSEQVGIVKADSGTSAVFDALSEYHLNFGPAGVFALFAVHGWYLATLYDWLVRRGRHYLIGISIFLCLIPGNWDFFGLGNNLLLHLKIVPAWLLLFYLISRK